MESYDNTIKYYELLMFYDNTSIYTKYELPNGYHWKYYEPGDEIDWINIHLSTGEFTSIEKGSEYFQSFYGYFINELNKRCIFIVDDLTNNKVATVTISLLKDSEYGYTGAVDWLAISKPYQGKKLFKPLISKTLEIANSLHHDKIILHTQTTTWLAAKLYLDYGFNILNHDEVDGYNILKTLTNHPKLSKYQIVPLESIYDQRNIEIKRQLTNIYQSTNFNFDVWYKNNQHDVYTYFNNHSYHYKYYIDINNNITLKEV